MCLFRGVYGAGMYMCQTFRVCTRFYEYMKSSVYVHYLGEYMGPGCIFARYLGFALAYTSTLATEYMCSTWGVYGAGTYMCQTFRVCARSYEYIGSSVYVHDLGEYMGQGCTCARHLGFALAHTSICCLEYMCTT